MPQEYYYNRDNTAEADIVDLNKEKKVSPL
jgi:hypothetical protein